MISSDLTLLAQQEDLPVFHGSTWDEHVSTWLMIQDSLEQHLWHLAAIAASLTIRYGEGDVRRFAHEVGRSTQRIYQLATTYRAFENARKSEILSFQHHTIAALSEDPEAVITMAEVEGMSTRQLEAAVKGKEYEPYVPADRKAQEKAQIPKRLENWYGFIKAQTCLRCGSSQHVEAAHLQALVSRKTGDVMPRSHKGIAAYACIPLCATCHRTGEDSIHQIGEATFMQTLGRSPDWIYRWLCTAVLEFFVGEA